MDAVASGLSSGGGDPAMVLLLLLLGMGRDGRDDGPRHRGGAESHGSFLR